MAAEATFITGLDRAQLIRALGAVRKGDFSVRLPMPLHDGDASIAEIFNDIVQMLEGTTNEFERVGEVVGKEGRIGQRASLPGATGSGGN